MDDPRKGREPGFTLSSSKQLVVQTRRAIFGIFLVLDAAALGFAAATLHLRNKPAPLYESNDVVTSTLLPVVVTAIDGLWVAALWLLDRYYPVTFLSKPVGELASLVILTVLHLTTALYLYFDLSQTPFSAEPSDYTLFQQRSFAITALILVLSLLLQAIALTFSLLVVLYSTIRYVRAGRWDALDHPICRYDPKAVMLHRHPLEFLQHNPSTLHMLSSTNLRSSSHTERTQNASRDPSRDTGNDLVSNYHPREGQTVGDGSTTGSRGRPGVGTSQRAGSIPMRGIV